jgi:hypothetical protein
MSVMNDMNPAEMLVEQRRDEAIEGVRASAGAVCAASPSYMEINAKVIGEMQALMAELKVLGL